MGFAPALRILQTEELQTEERETRRNISTHITSPRAPINVANMSRRCRTVDAFGRPFVRRVWGHGSAVFGPNLLGV